MGFTRAPDGEGPESSEVEFFGVKLKVRNPHLAALLNSSVHEDVQVSGQRARDAFSADDEARVARDVQQRPQGADDSVRILPSDTAED